MLKTGDPLIQFHLHRILIQGTQKRWLLKTGDPLIEVTTKTGLPVVTKTDINLNSNNSFISVLNY